MIPRYRAWIKTENCFADYIESIRFYINEIDLCWGGICESDCFNFEDVIFTQSTRFTDDIGEEIFEGDVILWTYWDEFEDSGRAKIVFKEGMFKLLDVRTGEEVWDNLFDCIENCNVYLQGNIYENPEFLEDKE
ncbi:YopX family protein [Streptococcus sp. 53]|uniref:YopX family protein n=1 Tax=Streptococcus sp. 53 TaxID=2582679 RepID=UPI001565F22B|nr:YopX family protein [Streptococcus sp. 53]